MGARQAEVFEASRAIDVPDGKPLRAAAARASALDRVQDGALRGFDRRDADGEAIRGAVSAPKAEAATKTEFDGLGRGPGPSGRRGLAAWMLGVLPAANVAILFKVFAL